LSRTVIAALSAVDVDLAEELQAGRRRQVDLARRWRFDEYGFRPEGVVEPVRVRRCRRERPG
jgi:hypothetical protein